METGIIVGLLNLVLLVAIAFWMRSKHRFLFRKILDLQFKCRQQFFDFRDELRKHSRLLQMEQDQLMNGAATLPPRFTAQTGEDILIYDFFKGHGPGYFIEAGAYDGVTFSNTYLLESLGWRGMLIEPLPELADLCRKNRPNSIVVQAALGSGASDGEVEFTCAYDPRGGACLSYLKADQGHVDRCRDAKYSLVPVRVPIKSLNSLLEGRSESVDFISLDVEGMEVEVLRGFDLERFKPKLIVVERQDEKRKNEILAKHLTDRDYTAVAEKGCNVFYVINSMKKALESFLCEDEAFANRGYLP